MSDEPTNVMRAMIPLMRRVMPTMMASEIAGIQPMTSPSPSIFALKARYAGFVDGCTGLDCGLGPEMTPSYGAIYGTIVDFPMTHPLRNNAQTAVMWALQNVRRSFNYSIVVIGTELNPKDTDPRIQKIRPAHRVWRWTFVDQDDAFSFKVRWM